MQYNPEEVTNLLDTTAEGSWIITEGIDCKSQAGNEQMKLTMRGRDIKNKEMPLTYYVVFPWQLKKLCESANRIDIFNKGIVHAHELKGLSGKCIFKTEVDPSGKYDDKTVIGKFLKATEGSANKNSPSEDAFHDDDIPF